MDDGKRFEETVFALVARLAPDKLSDGAVKASLHLRRDLGLDSLGLVNLLSTFGDELGIDPNDLIEQLAESPINTVGEMVAFGRRLMARAARAPQA